MRDENWNCWCWCRGDGLCGLLNNSVAEINAKRVAAGSDVKGHRDGDTRYALENVPIGLIPTLLLGKLSGIFARLHNAVVDILSATMVAIFVGDYDLLPELANWRL